jgi:iron complex outermembrane receptor protein
MLNRYTFLLLLTFVQINVFAQDSTRTLDLNEVVISANILGTELKNTGRNITIIDRKTIENAPVKSLDGILQYAQNVDVRSRSSSGVQADISIRGGHYDQTLILVDGVKVNDPQTGHHSLNIPIPFHLIEKIEVMQGGASRVYGPNAFSGVVNIITRKIKDDALNIMALGGQYGLWQLLASGQKQFNDNQGIRLSLESGGSKGFTDYTGYKKTSGNVLFTQNLKQGQLDINFGFMENNFEASNFYHPKFGKQYEEVKAIMGSGLLNHNFSNSTTGVALVSWRRHFDMFDFNEYRLNNKGSLINFHRSDVLEADYKLRKIHKRSKSAIGINYRSESIISNRLGKAVEFPIATKYSDTLYYNKSAVRNNFSFFLEHQHTFKKFSFSGGLLANYNTDFGTAFYPGIDLTFPLKTDQKLYLSANHSLRYPTFTELYLTGPTVIADPKLKPEKAWTQEAGYRISKYNWLGAISIFYRKTFDAIDKIKRPELTVPTMENIDNINMAGLELSQTLFLSKITNIRFPTKVIWNYAYLLADRKEQGFQSFYTLNYLRHKFTVGLETEPIQKFNTSIFYTFKYREGEYQLDGSSPLISYKPVHLIDLRMSYQFKKHRLFADFNNLLNYEYFEFGFVKQPGIWISSGIILNF